MTTETLFHALLDVLEAMGRPDVATYAKRNQARIEAMLAPIAAAIQAKQGAAVTGSNNAAPIQPSTPAALRPIVQRYVAWLRENAPASRGTKHKIDVPALRVNPAPPDRARTMRRFLAAFPDDEANRWWKSSHQWYAAATRAEWAHFAPEGWLPRPEKGTAYSAKEIRGLAYWWVSTFAPCVALSERAIALDKRFLPNLYAGEAFHKIPPGERFLATYLSGVRGQGDTLERYVKDRLNLIVKQFLPDTDNPIHYSSLAQMYGEEAHAFQWVSPRTVPLEQVIARYNGQRRDGTTQTSVPERLADLSAYLDAVEAAKRLWEVKVSRPYGWPPDQQLRDPSVPPAAETWAILRGLSYSASRDYDLEVMRDLYGLDYERHGGWEAQKRNEKLRAQMTARLGEVFDQQARARIDAETKAEHAARTRTAEAARIAPAAQRLLDSGKQIDTRKIQAILPTGYTYSNRYGPEILFPSGSRVFVSHSSGPAPSWAHAKKVARPTLYDAHAQLLADLIKAAGRKPDTGWSDEDDDPLPPETP